MSPSSPSVGIQSSLPGAGCRRSQFTYRQLSQLASFQPTNPLRVVAHIDLDAFYAQCEMVRLNLPEDQPLAVQQWQGLIAVNYAARDSGIGRHCNVAEAKRLCPTLIAQHVATWREGDDKWAYRDDAAANIAKDKVSLDPYRLQSRKILAAIKDSLPANLQRVEKAGIDEVFLDLSAHVHAELLERFPELTSPAPYDDPTENLPLPSISALDWQADALVDLEEEEEIADPDWDDVAILIGSEIVRDVRARIRNELGYTCSGGIASNKLLSKLGSAYKKPNRQTVIRNRAISSFVGGFKVTKMRNLGGKLGEQVVSVFQSEDVSQLLLVPLDQMKQKLGEDTGLWVYNTIRGIDTSEVNARTQIKSMLSAKSFRPTISTAEQAIKWLRIFAADIYARLVEEGILEHKRRPRTINLHHRHAGQTRSRQSPIPQGKSVDENGLFELAKDLLGQIIAEGQVWPCANLSLSVGGFEDGPRGNMGIGAFLVRGEEAEMLHQATPDYQHASTGSDRPAKKRRAEESIHRFLAKKPAAGEMITGDHGDQSTHQNEQATDFGGGSDALESAGRIHINDMEVEQPEQGCDIGFGFGQLECSRCKATFGDPEELQAHSDWHMAKDLQDQERVKTTFAERPASSRNSDPKGPRASSKRGRGEKLEPGQSRLNFG